MVAHAHRRVVKNLQLTAIVSIQLPVLGNLACRLLVEVLVRVAGVKEFSVAVPVPRRSACAVVPEAEVEHEILCPIAVSEPSLLEQASGGSESI